MKRKKINIKPIVLVILDGYGEWSTRIGNPLTVANKPTLDNLDLTYPKILLEASGLAVGLPWGVCGNSEVGHQTIGTGQVIYHLLPAIDAALQTGKVLENQALLKAVDTCLEKDSSLHLIGLLSDGGVHSHIKHLEGLLQAVRDLGVRKVYLHVITDGRDTAPKSAKLYLAELKNTISKIGIGEIASVCGRYYAMDRNNNWDRLEKAFLTYTEGEGFSASSAEEAVDMQYKKGVSDEYLEPVVILDKKNKPLATIKDNDSIICFNYRGDRSRQITKAFALQGFDEFEKARQPQGITYVSFSQYEKGLPVEVMFPPQEITTRLGEVLSRSNLKQLRIAETEKFAHVTYFFNGGLDDPFVGEDRIFVPSKNVPSYATVPEMSAGEVTEKLLKAIKKDKYHFVLVNYANTDMVGHTGDFQAGVKTIEYVDKCLGELMELVLEKDGQLLITADHGNIEEMINLQTGEIDTKHSTNPVPLWYVSNKNKKNKDKSYSFLPKSRGMLVDIAPTILELLKIEKPDDMVGWSLLGRLEVDK